MSATFAYSEPYKLPAGAMAVAVHAAFFALLYFGVNWRTQAPQGMTVDLWSSLPDVKTVPASVLPQRTIPQPPPKPVEPSKTVVPPKPVEPVRKAPPPKADIELAEKKKPKPKLVETKKPVEAEKPTVPEMTAAEKAAQAAQAERAAAQARQAAEAAAAITSEIQKYTGLIRARIRRFIVMPPDVPDNVQAEFDVTLLPDGEVLDDPKLVKSSGNAAYDDAVMRAILKAQPLPLPPDVTLFNQNFRNLHLKFRPKE
jgi:colicin import membrane protein